MYDVAWLKMATSTEENPTYILRSLRELHHTMLSKMVHKNMRKPSEGGYAPAYELVTGTIRRLPHGSLKRRAPYTRERYPLFRGLNHDLGERAFFKVFIL